MIGKRELGPFNRRSTLYGRLTAWVRRRPRWQHWGREQFGWTLERCASLLIGARGTATVPRGPNHSADQVAKGQGRKVLFGGGRRPPQRWVSSPKGRAARSCLEVLAFAPTVDAAIVGSCENPARFEAFFAGVARALRGSSRQQLVTPTCSWAGKPVWWLGGGCVASAARHGRRAGCLAKLSRFPGVRVEARVAAVAILVFRVVHRSNALRAFPDG